AARPEGARVELDESLNTINAKHCGEGFLEVDSASPYRLDTAAQELQEVASVRTLLYERGGYGALSDIQRE
ncbi:hypothetical protein FRC11_000413, partial [Ceratobasidium sp. 423]